MNSKSVKEGGKHNMYSKSKRFIASFLAVLMAVCMLPADMLGAVGVVHAEGEIVATLTVGTGEDATTTTETTYKIPYGKTGSLVLTGPATQIYVLDNSDATAYAAVEPEGTVTMGDGDEKPDTEPAKGDKYTAGSSISIEVAKTLKAFTIVEDDSSTPSTYKYDKVVELKYTMGLEATATPSLDTISLITEEGADKNKSKAVLTVAEGATVKYYDVTGIANDTTDADEKAKLEADAAKILTDGTEYSDTTGIVFDTEMKIRVAAQATGKDPSAVAELTLTLAPVTPPAGVTVGTVKATPGQGAVTSGTTVALSYEAGTGDATTAEIYYKTYPTATAPTTAPATSELTDKYTTTPISITAATTIYAVAKADNNGTDVYGEVAKFAYTISGGTQPPTPGAKQNRKLDIKDASHTTIGDTPYTKNGFTFLKGMNLSNSNKRYFDWGSDDGRGEVEYNERAQFPKDKSGEFEKDSDGTLKKDADGNVIVTGSVKFDAQEGAIVTILGISGNSGKTVDVYLSQLENDTLVKKVDFSNCPIDSYTRRDTSTGTTKDYMEAHEAEIPADGTYYVIAVSHDTSNATAFNMHYIEVKYPGVDGWTEDTTATVTFEANGGSPVAAQKVTIGSTCLEYATIKDGFDFGGWYTDANCTTPFDFKTPVNADLKLYAKWTAEENSTPFTLNISNLPIGGFDEGFTKNGFKVGKKVTIDESGATVDSDSYTNRLKLNGKTQNAGEREIEFTIEKPSRLTVVAAASADSARTLCVGTSITDDTTTILGAITKATKKEVLLTTAGTYHIWCKDNAFNIYYLSVDSKLLTPTISYDKGTVNNETGAITLERDAAITITNPNSGDAADVSVSYAVNDGEFTAYSDTAPIVAGNLVGEAGGSLTIKVQVIPKATNTDYTASDEVTVTYTVKAEGGDEPGPGPDPDPDPDPDDENWYWDEDLPYAMETFGEIPDGLWIAGVDEDGYYYDNGAKITPATPYYDWEMEDYYYPVRVYHGSKLLKEKVDYTVSYKNNVNVPKDAAENKQPTIVVKGKGSYSGSATKTFKIIPYSLNWTDSDSEMAVLAKSGNKEQKPVPTVSVTLDNGKIKKLKNKTDFAVKYYKAADQEDPQPSDTVAEADLKEAVTEPAIYYARVTGGTNGNYAGNVDIKLTVAESTAILASKLKVTFSKVTYDKSKTTAEGFEGFKPETITVKAGGDTINEGTDYTVTYPYDLAYNYDAGDTVTVTIEPVAGTDGKTKFVGTRYASYKINGKPIKSAKVTLPAAKDLVYKGEGIEAFTESDISLKDLTYGTDYSIDIYGNYNAGKATIYINGIGEYEGTVKKTVTIKPLALDETNFTYNIGNYVLGEDGKYTYDAKAPYVKGGSKAEVAVSHTYTVGEGEDAMQYTDSLNPDEDYTLSYSNNKKFGKTAKVTIKGKGNFKGSIKKEFSLAEKTLEGNVTLVVNDVAVAKNPAKDANYDCKPVLVDADGVKLAKGDYKIEYFDITPPKADDPAPAPETSVEIAEGEEGEGGDQPTGPSPITKITKYKADVGTVIKVVATGEATKGYTGTLEATYEVRANNFAKAKITIVPQPYDGKPVEFAIKDGDITGVTVKCGDATLKPKASKDSTEDGYYIASYDKNDKKGTAKVTLVGTGSYAGSKTASFKITAKTMAWWTKPSGSASEALEYIKDAVTGLFN